jgi:predicted O-linked N-acetylglucosamine transferase (SPINDLY family)
VLGAVPRSRLLIRAAGTSARERVLAALAQGGVEAGRVEFAERVPRAEYFRQYQRIDIGLDPFPYNGGTTTLDACWMGVPTVTLVGKMPAGRAGWSLACNLGLPELAAESADRYVTLAAEVARDLTRLRELRGTLRQRLQRSPLMDARRFARHVEQAFRQIWRRWCAGSKP